MPLGAAEDHHDIRRHAKLVVPLHRVPKQVTGDEDVCFIHEHGVEAALDRGDGFKLPRIFRHRLPVALRVNDIGSRNFRFDIHGNASASRSKQGVDPADRHC